MKLKPVRHTELAVEPFGFGEKLFEARASFLLLPGDVVDEDFGVVLEFKAVWQRLWIINVLLVDERDRSAAVRNKVSGDRGHVKEIVRNDVYVLAES